MFLHFIKKNKKNNMSVVPGSYRERLDGELEASVGFLQHLVIFAAKCRFLARSTSMVNLRIKRGEGGMMRSLLAGMVYWSVLQLQSL